MPREFGEQSHEELQPFEVRKSSEGKFFALLPLDAAMASYQTENVPKVVRDGTLCVEVALEATTQEEAEKEVNKAFESMDESLG